MGFAHRRTPSHLISDLWAEINNGSAEGRSWKTMLDHISISHQSMSFTKKAFVG